MSDCIFCQIKNNRVPVHSVWENDHALAFLDNSPKNCGHTLVISKKHYPDLYSAPAEELARIIKAVRQVAQKINQSLAPAAVKIVQNNGSAAGQTIAHLHFHIIPYYTNHAPYDKKEFDKIAAKINA